MELFVCIQVNFWVKYWFFTKYLLNISLIPCAENKRFFAQYLVTMKFLQPAHPLFFTYTYYYTNNQPQSWKGEKICVKTYVKKNLISLIEHAYSLPPSPSNLFFIYSDLMKIWILNCTIYYCSKTFFLTQTHYNNPQISSWKTTFSLFSTIIFFWPNYYYLNFGSNIFQEPKSQNLEKKVWLTK